MRPQRTSHLTERGRALLAAGGTLAIAGVALGYPDLTKVGLLSLLLPALTYLLTRLPAPRVEVHRQWSGTQPTVGIPTVMTLRVHHRHGRPTPPLTLSDPITAAHSTPTALVPPLRHGHTATTSYTLTPPTRGELRVGPATGTFNDALGLTTTTWRMGTPDTCIVLPRTHSLTTDPRSAPGASADHVEHTHLGVRGDDDVAIRTYTEGDDLRRVHWPITAHRGTLMVREEGRPSGRRALVVVDHRPPPTSCPVLRDALRDLDLAVELAASVCAHLHRSGFTVTVVTPEHVHLATPRSDSTELLRHLAVLPTLPATSATLSALAHHFGTHAQQHGIAVAISTGTLVGDLHPVLASRPLSTTGFLMVVDSRTAPETATHLDAARRLQWHAQACASAEDFASTWSSLLAQPTGVQ